MELWQMDVGLTHVEGIPGLKNLHAMADEATGKFVAGILYETEAGPSPSEGEAIM